MQDKEKIIINYHIQDDPLSEENLDKTLNYLHEFRLLMPEKTIWLYSGYTWEQLFEDGKFDIDGGICENQIRRAIVLLSDVFVDGRYIDSQRDISLAYRGSKNQRVIAVQESIRQNKVVLHCN